MKLKGILFVLIGAISYGLPASLNKLARQHGLTEANILLAQFFLAFLSLGVIYYFFNLKNNNDKIILNKKTKTRLIIAGSALALTNSFYFTSLGYVSVVIAAVMLMQSVWITTVFDFYFKKIFPSRTQIICIFIVLIGTVFATNLIDTTVVISPLGLFLSFMSGVCYAITIMVTNSLAPKASSIGRAYYISMGAFFVICLIWAWKADLPTLLLSLKWGFVIAIFSIILPLWCFTKGMPQITAGIGGVLSALELPAAIIFAFLLLNENINIVQFLGVILILTAIIAINLIKKR